jgi:hypothetical protein
MQNISSNGNGQGPDIVLIQTEGKTGDQVDRDVAMAKSANEYRKQMGQVPEQNKAQVYDGAWKGVGQGGQGGRAENVGR